MKHGQEPPKKGKGSKLTPKMEMFVEHYLVNSNATESVRLAGYKTNNPNRMGTQLLQHPLVKAAIEEAQEARRERMELTADYVLTKLVDIVENTEKGNPSAALRGLELLGKNLGIFRDKTEISGPDGEAIRVEEQKTEQNVSDFRSKLTRLAKRDGTGNVVELPVTEGDRKA